MILHPGYCIFGWLQMYLVMILFLVHVHYYPGRYINSCKLTNTIYLKWKPRITCTLVMDLFILGLLLYPVGIVLLWICTCTCACICMICICLKRVGERVWLHGKEPTVVYGGYDATEARTLQTSTRRYNHQHSPSKYIH